MAFLITKKKAAEIEEELLPEFGWGDARTMPEDTFKNLTDSCVMHYFVNYYRGDIDQSPILWIINNPYCDKATALMAFWRVGPAYYTQFANQHDADENYGGFNYMLLKKILSNWQNGFYVNQKIAYNPYVANIPDSPDYKHANAKWDIPDYMRQSLEGEDVIVEQ